MTIGVKVDAGHSPAIREGEDLEDLLDEIRRSIIEPGAPLFGPFGARPLVYADYAASGRPLGFVEDFLRQHVLPFYGNTHSEETTTAKAMSALRESARSVVREALGASDRFAVVFVGSGATGALDKLVRILCRRAARPDGEVAEDFRPVVLVGPYEHHSNELIWRESGFAVVPVPEDADGKIDVAALRAACVSHSEARLLVGSFSAASNVSGVISTTSEITRVLHQYGALAVWDYAAAAPHMAADVAGPDEMTWKDAVALSPHKLIGGPGTPGVLVVRRELVGEVPTVPGGGTVCYVSERTQRYSSDPVIREAAGTPDIIGSVRAGLAFGLQAAVGMSNVKWIERSLARRVVGELSGCPNVAVLGPTSVQRLPIVSFVVRHRGRFLHHNFIVAVLNDLFGVQARGGCSCAGPYGHRLLGLDPNLSGAFDSLVARGFGGIKPGWTRLSFSFHQEDWEVDYVLAAVGAVAAHGHRLLRTYAFDPCTGSWRYRGTERLSLAVPTLRSPWRPGFDGRDAKGAGGSVLSGDPLAPARGRGSPGELDACLERGRSTLELRRDDPTLSDAPPIEDLEFERLRWFWHTVTATSLEAPAPRDRATPAEAETPYAATAPGSGLL